MSCIRGRALAIPSISLGDGCGGCKSSHDRGSGRDGGSDQTTHSIPHPRETPVFFGNALHYIQNASLEHYRIANSGSDVRVSA